MALQAAAHRVQQHRGFQAASAAFAGNVLATFNTQRMLRRLMHDTARFALLCILLHLDREARFSKHGPGATTAQIIALMQRGRFAGASQVKVLIALLRLAKCLESVVSPLDRRARVLRPTERMLAPMRAWLTGNLAVVQKVMDLPAPMTQMLSVLALLQEFLALNARAFVDDSFTLMEDMPQVAACMRRDCGYLLLMQLIATRCLVPGTDILEAQVAVPAFAQRFGVSRSHVRNLLAHGWNDGWFAQAPGVSSALLLTPAFNRTADQWMAREFVWTAEIAGIAYEKLQKISVQTAAHSISSRTIHGLLQG